MNRHLVTVKVRIVRRTHKGVKPYSFAFHQNRLKSLDRHPVKGGSPVKENGMLFYNLLKTLPHLRCFLLHKFLSILYGCCISFFLKSSVNKRLEQFKCHYLRKTALVHLKLRINNYNGSSRIINPFSEEVLPEPTLLTFKIIRKGLKGSSVLSNNLTPLTVVYKGIYSLLEHPLFVSYYYLGCIKLYKSFKPVIPIN